MARLFKTTSAGAELVLDRLDIAESFWSRGKGLLGHKHLHVNEGLWIKPCNNIHTFFMKFAIDCIFLDKKMEVQKTVENVGPFKFAGPYWKTYSVIEVAAGVIQQKKLKIGDHLYVVD